MYNTYLIHMSKEPDWGILNSLMKMGRAVGFEGGVVTAVTAVGDIMIINFMGADKLNYALPFTVVGAAIFVGAIIWGAFRRASGRSD